MTEEARPMESVSKAVKKRGKGAGLAPTPGTRSRLPSAVEMSEARPCRDSVLLQEAQIKMLGTDIGHGMTLLFTSCS